MGTTRSSQWACEMEKGRMWENSQALTLLWKQGKANGKIDPSVDISDFLFQSVVYLTTFLIFLLWFPTFLVTQFKKKKKKKTLPLWGSDELSIELFLFILLLMISYCNHNLGKFYSLQMFCVKGCSDLIHELFS